MVFIGCVDEIQASAPQPEASISYPDRYYIDPDNGMYYNTGHSPENAWESVDRINERIWQPGDTILIKRGTIYEGALTLRGNGTAEKPIVITSYGDESLPLPVIAGGGRNEAVLMRNIQYWEIEKLHITNKGEAPVPKSVGIRIEADNIEGGVMNHIHIRDCVISDVYGTPTHHNNNGGSAIYYYNIINTSTPSSFNDFVVERCHIYDCQRDGINGWVATGDRQFRKASTGVVFRDNLIERVPGDQIKVNSCDGAIVEGNVIRDCAPGAWADDSIIYNREAAAGLWCIHSDGTIFRYNIVQDHKATWDGQAFDCDQNCTNTLFEYNISYNNEGGWLMLCPLDQQFNQGYAEQTGTVVRYNISINDGIRNYLKGNGQAHSATIDVVGRVAECHFYNNTIVKTVSAEEIYDNTAIAFDNYTNIPNSLKFTNNIFYNTTGKANPFLRVISGEYTPNTGLVLENNCIYGYEDGTVPTDDVYNSNPMYQDPKFVDVLKNFLEDNGLIDKEQILSGLSLSPDSPCLGAGLPVEPEEYFPIGNDFWNEPLGDSWNIGAFNH